MRNTYKELRKLQNYVFRLAFEGKIDSEYASKIFSKLENIKDGVQNTQTAINAIVNGMKK